MSGFSFILVGIISGCVMLGYVLLLVQSARQNRQIRQLQAQLEVFVDSSINVARSVDVLLKQGHSTSLASVASRRWVLAEARKRINSGEDLQDVARPLGLSSDEARLLKAALS